MRRTLFTAALAVFVLASLIGIGYSKVWFEGGGGCEFEEEPLDTLPEPEPDWDPLDKYHRYGSGDGEFDISAVNPTFDNLFDLWVTDGVVGRWDSTTIADLTFKIVDDDSTNDDDVFPNVWDYFTDGDEDPTYGGLQYTFSDDSVYTRIMLRLYDNEDFTGACGEPAYRRECANRSTVFRPQENEGPYRAFTIMIVTPDSLRACDGPWTEFTIDQLARDTFAHELQHVCFALSGHSSTYSNVNESLSKLAEYRAGSVQNMDCDLSYDASVLRGDRCESTEKYMIELTWMAYLFDRFAVNPSDPTDDLVYRWVREEAVTLESLAALLEDADFAWLGGESGDERFRNLFQNYAVAKFADTPNVTADSRYGYEIFNPTQDVGLTLDNCMFYALGSCPRRPVDCSGPPANCGIHSGCWNVKIIPPTHLVTSGNEDALATVTGYFEDPGDASRDSIEVASYGTDFIIFKADDYYDDGEQHEFHFNLAKVAGAMPLNTRLQVSIIGYSSVEDTLQLHPEDVVFVAPLNIGVGVPTVL